MKRIVIFFLLFSIIINYNGKIVKAEVQEITDFYKLYYTNSNFYKNTAFYVNANNGPKYIIGFNNFETNIEPPYIDKLIVSFHGNGETPLFDGIQVAEIPSGGFNYEFHYYPYPRRIITAELSVEIKNTGWYTITILTSSGLQGGQQGFVFNSSKVLISDTPIWIKSISDFTSPNNNSSYNNPVNFKFKAYTNIPASIAINAIHKNEVKQLWGSSFLNELNFNNNLYLEPGINEVYISIYKGTETFESEHKLINVAGTSTLYQDIEVSDAEDFYGNITGGYLGSSTIIYQILTAGINEIRKPFIRIVNEVKKYISEQKKQEIITNLQEKAGKLKGNMLIIENYLGMNEGLLTTLIIFIIILLTITGIISILKKFWPF